jgi:excisionase family DNA binding protein
MIRARKERYLLSIGEAAEMLGLSRSTLYKYTEQGVLPSVKIGSRVLIDAEELYSWLGERRRGAD